MSVIENLQKEVCRLRQQINEKNYSESELEDLYNEINNVIRQMTKLRGKIFSKHYALKTKDLIKNS